MAKIKLSTIAEEDLVSALSWSHRNFGEPARIRYEALVAQAIVDIADAPNRLGVVNREEIQSLLFSYHLWHSRLNVSLSIGRVSKPRHFLLFRQTQNNIEIGRILHNSMDFTRHIPLEFTGP